MDAQDNEVPSGDSAGGQVSNLQRAVVDRAWRAMEQDNMAEALALVEEGVLLDRARPQVWNAYGQVLRKAGELRAAAHAFRRAIQLWPQYAGAWSELGSALSQAKSIERSLACHREALRLAPHEADLHHNHGAALMQAGREAEAIVAFEEALRLNPARPRTRWERGACVLRLGDLPSGWDDYEMRLHPAVRQTDQRLGAPRWAGEPLEGRRILILAEQGLGDMIWCARYLRRVKAAGGYVIVQCGRELTALFQPLEGADEVLRLSEPLPYVDCYIEMCSLPRLFTRGVKDVEGRAYLQPSPERYGKFDAWLAPPGSPLKVGANWSGNPRFPNNADRSIDVGLLLHALDQPGVQLYSLQKGAAAAALGGVDVPGLARPRIVELGGLVDDLADTAEICRNLDLVVTTDTALAHLAGALGVTVWLLLNYRAYWLWGLDAERTPWYSSMRLFRAERWDGWADVADKAAAQLMQSLRHPDPSTNITGL